MVHTDLFSYSAALLEQYRHATRVWTISVGNFQDGQWRERQLLLQSPTPLLGLGQPSAIPAHSATFTPMPRRYCSTNIGGYIP